MRVFNEDKTQELKEYDLNKGHLKLDKLFIRHHEAVEELEELNKPSELEILKREQEVTAQAVQDLILMTLGGN